MTGLNQRFEALQLLQQLGQLHTHRVQQRLAFDGRGRGGVRLLLSAAPAPTGAPALPRMIAPFPAINETQPAPPLLSARERRIQGCPHPQNRPNQPRVPAKTHPHAPLLLP
jgi:hypothetical protein